MNARTSYTMAAMYLRAPMALILAAASGPLLAQEDPTDVAAKIARLDEQLVPALTELAFHFDKQGDPEAVAFFAECALGLGSPHAHLAEIKKKWEDEVYYGRAPGGKVLAETKPIEERLTKLSPEYRAIVASLMKMAKLRALTERERAAMHQAVIRTELSRGAHEYVQATQRFNELRRHMRLRAILWDFTGSRDFILAAWYMAETGDYLDKHSQTGHIAYTPQVESVKARAAKSGNPRYELPRHSDHIRSFALIRQSLLEPDARLLQLGCWSDSASHFKRMVAYDIPPLRYRSDITTPTTRAANATVAEARDRWRDVEQTLAIGSQRVIYSYYPYSDEPDAPWAFGDGEGSEHRWHDPAIKSLLFCGTPIMLRFFTRGKEGEARLENVRAEVRKEKGPSVRCRLYLTGDKRVEMNSSHPTILILPEKQLERDTPYRVSIKCTLSGVAFEKAWSFRTRRD